MLPDIILAIANPAEGGLATEFGFNKGLILAQIVNFGILAFILYQFAIKPVLSTMEERQNKIEEGLKDAEKMKEELAKAEQSRKETMQEAQKQAQITIKEAQDAAKVILEKETQAAISKAEAIIKKGEAAIAQERQKMLSEVRQEVAALVVQTTGKVLKREIKPDEQKSLNDAAAKELAGAN